MENSSALGDSRATLLDLRLQDELEVEEKNEEGRGGLVSELLEEFIGETGDEVGVEKLLVFNPFDDFERSEKELPKELRNLRLRSPKLSLPSPCTFFLAPLVPSSHFSALVRVSPSATILTKNKTIKQLS